MHKFTFPTNSAQGFSFSKSLLFFFGFLGPHLQHMKIPGQLPAHATTTATAALSFACTLHHSSWQFWILNLLSEVRGQTMDTSQVLNLLKTMTDTPIFFFFFSFLIVAIITSRRWYLIVVLISVSLMFSHVEHFSLCLLAICVSYCGKCQFKSSTSFLIGLFVFCCQDVRVLYDLQIFYKYFT